MDFHSWRDSLQTIVLASLVEWWVPIKAVSSGGRGKADLERPALQCTPLSLLLQFRVCQPGHMVRTIIYHSSCPLDASANQAS